VVSVPVACSVQSPTGRTLHQLREMYFVQSPTRRTPHRLLLKVRRHVCVVRTSVPICVVKCVCRCRCRCVSICPHPGILHITRHIHMHTGIQNIYGIQKLPCPYMLWPPDACVSIMLMATLCMCVHSWL